MIQLISTQNIEVFDTNEWGAGKHNDNNKKLSIYIIVEITYPLFKFNIRTVHY
jgi:hypothetical protein